MNTDEHGKETGSGYELGTPSVAVVAFTDDDSPVEAASTCATCPPDDLIEVEKGSAITQHAAVSS